MSSSNNKIDDIIGFDSNQLTESLLNNNIDDLILVVSKILESWPGNKTTGAGKLYAKFKKLRNLLNQACSSNSLKNAEKYLAQIRQLKAEFTQLSGRKDDSKITNNPTMQPCCSFAIKALESLISHITIKQKEITSSIATKCHNLYDDFTTVPRVSLFTYPVLHGKSPNNGRKEERDEDVDKNDTNKKSPGSPANGSASHATTQAVLDNSVSVTEGDANSDHSTTMDGSDVGMEYNNNATDTDNSTLMGNTNSLTVAQDGFVAKTNPSHSSHNSGLSGIAQESGDQSNGLHQYNNPPLLEPSSKGSTVSSSIQPFPHTEAREETAQQDIEPHHRVYTGGEEVGTVQEGNDHPNHSQLTYHSNAGSTSDTENLLPAVLPALASEVKSTVQQISLQMFTSTLGEPDGPLNHSDESMQIGALHATPDQVTCDAVPESEFFTATAATKLNNTTHLELTVENNEQCILGYQQ